LHGAGIFQSRLPNDEMSPRLLWSLPETADPRCLASLLRVSDPTPTLLYYSSSTGTRTGVMLSPERRSKRELASTASYETIRRQ